MVNIWTSFGTEQNKLVAVVQYRDEKFTLLWICLIIIIIVVVFYFQLRYVHLHRSASGLWN